MATTMTTIMPGTVTVPADTTTIMNLAQGAFALGSAVNAAFVMAEAVFGLTLLADAAHNLGVIRRPAAPTDMAAAPFWPR